MNSGLSQLIVEPIDETAAQDIAEACGLGSLASRILVRRGINTPQSARAFLTPSLERDWRDPETIPGMSDVGDVVQNAIEADKSILVFGDFDVDGITATAIAVRGLRALGAHVDGIIPHRYDEGYALSPAAIERAMTYDPDLIITVDCGISCAQEVEELLGRGVDVCITDHHEPGDHVPSAVPVTDPKLDAPCDFRELAGAGVALKLISLLGKRMSQPDLWLDLIDLAALGTIADLMPLLDENRALAAAGIDRIRTCPRPGLVALAAVCSADIETITSMRLSFTLIPRLNAAGRMGDASIAYDLLMCDTPQEAQEIASKLEDINSLRRKSEGELNELVVEQLETSKTKDQIIIAAGEGWHEGVKGIVASRIARANKKPAIIFSIEDGQARGSGRSYGDINLFELASTCSDMFEKFGGHAAAIGITLPADKLGELHERLADQLVIMQQQAPCEGTKVDIIARVEDCTLAQFEDIEKLQPFGKENPEPILALQNVFLERRNAVGKLGNHLSFEATDGVARVSGIFFGPDNIQDLLDHASVCDVVFEPSVNEFRGAKQPKLMTKEIILETSTEDDQGVDRYEELLSLSDALFETGDYAGILQASRFNTKVVGVTFENRQDVLANLEVGTELKLQREPHNEFDENAISVTLLDGTQLGYLNRHLAKCLARAMDGGAAYDAVVSSVTGGAASAGNQDDDRKPGPLGVRDPGVINRSYGVNILVRNVELDLTSDDASSDEEAAELRRTREGLQALKPAELDATIRKALIGDHELHDAQARALDALALGSNTLAIMATGRGKSLIFHLHAARTALLDGKASVFIYPLRALVADQAFHLKEKFKRFGLVVEVLTGETPDEEREAIYKGLADGSVNCILTTPEFLSIHAERFARTDRIGFVVIDEAHHIAQARAGNRSAYATLDDPLGKLGNPLVLAVTATAGTEQAQAIASTLSIQEFVLDPTVRANLHIDDRRDIRNREQYLANIIADGKKTVIYVNSRKQTVSLVKMLKKLLPKQAMRIMFYNAGLSKQDRKSIEDSFRTGEVSCIVSTSAFGEGIDIPDIEHVFLYHLPFNEIEFNQMSGRAGRDGRDATIHLLFGYSDARINESILKASAPSRDSLVALYRVLTSLSDEANAKGESGFSVTNGELAQRASRLDRNANLDEASVSCGISVFRELGFLQTSGASVARFITMNPNPGHMELEDSVRYREGLEELNTFNDFKTWAIKASPLDLLERFNRPILPDADFL